MELTPELRWVLRAAFKAPRDESPDRLGGQGMDGRAVAGIARELALAPRIVARTGVEALQAQLGAEAAELLVAERLGVAAQELRLDAALAEFVEVAERLGVPWVALKGTALRALGVVPEAGRPAADLDLLVPGRCVEELRRELIRNGFSDPGGSEYEHQSPVLVHARGGALEVHRMIPGVRVDGRRSAGFEVLERSGQLQIAPDGSCVPSRDVLVAHALAHTLAQHAFVASHAGALLVADLLDLGVAGDGRLVSERIVPWLERDVSARELDAAVGLAARLGGCDGEVEEFESDERRLLEHLVAMALDAAYGEAVKLRWLESPLSDRPRPLARLAAAWRAVVPLRRRGETPEPAGQHLARVARRPLDLWRRWRSARAAKREG